MFSFQGESNFTLDAYTYMKNTCIQCETDEMNHSHGVMVEGQYVEYCHDCYTGSTPDTVNNLNADKVGRKLSHWKDIQTRVKTHEGELLSGKKGHDYQRKWSQKYLGRDLGQSRPLTRNTVEEYNYKRKQ